MIIIYLEKVIDYLPRLTNCDFSILSKIGIEFENVKGGIIIDVPTNEKFLNIPAFIDRIYMHISNINRDVTSEAYVIKEIHLGEKIHDKNIQFCDLEFGAKYESIYQLAYLYNQHINIENNIIYYVTKNSSLTRGLGIREGIISDFWYTKMFINHLRQIYIITKIVEDNEQPSMYNKDIVDLARFPYIENPVLFSNLLNIEYSNFKWKVPCYLKHLEADHIFELLNISSTKQKIDFEITNINYEDICIDKINNALTSIPRAYTDTILVPDKTSHYHLLGNIKLNTGHFLRNGLAYGLLKFMADKQKLDYAYDIGKVFTKEKIVTERNVLSFIISKKYYNKKFPMFNNAIETNITYKSLHLENDIIMCGNIKVGKLQYYKYEFLPNWDLKQDYIIATL